MALTYTGTGGLFTILGKFFHAFETLGTVRRTTVKTEVQDAVNEYKLKTSATLDFDRAVNAAANAERSWRSSGDSLASALARDSQGLLTEVVAADSEIPTRGDLTEALEYLITKMDADGYYVAPATVTGTVAAVAGNSATDLAWFVSVKNHLALQSDTSLPEILEIACTEGGIYAEATHSLRIRGERSARSKLSEEWPSGSGINMIISPLGSGDSLLTNAGFEDAATAHTPDGWIIRAGTPGTTIKLTTFEKQQIAITGTPSAGTYLIRVIDGLTAAEGWTAEIAYNADGDTVQQALRAISGLTSSMASVTVTTSGTSPNYTHVVEFVGIRGNLSAMSVINHTTGGTFTVTTITNGETTAVRGRGLNFVQHGSELQIIAQHVTLEPDRVYFLGYWITPSDSPGAGQLRASLREDFSTLINDREGNQISQTTVLSGVTSKTSKGFFFAVPPTVVQPLLMVFDKTVAEPGADIIIDEVVLTEATELYPGGPYVAAMTGYRNPLEGDDWTLTVANNMASDFQKYFDAFFDTAGKRLLLPTNGSTQISEALIG